MAINCETPLEQLKKMILDKLKRHPEIALLGFDIEALLDKLMNLLAPFVWLNGLLGITSLIDKYIEDEVTVRKEQVVQKEEDDVLLTTHYLCNDSNFVLENWIDMPNAPLIADRINNLKRLHKEVLIPIVNYYKAKSDDKFIKDFCILKILTGLSTDLRLATTPVGEISHHYIGKAVNFRLIGIDDEVIIDDLINKRLPVNVGAFGNPNGVFVTLPYEVNGTRIENLHIFKDSYGNLTYNFI